ncbi:MAG: hypothetical protein DRO14_03085 [Thermoprotei archaeon]|nr:MAG: hypothetical protein DRO14_03085 [Thermoprotei archaeon]
MEQLPINEDFAIQQQLAQEYEERVKDMKSLYNSHYLNFVLITAFTRVAKKRAEIVKQVDEVKDFYLVEAIIQQLIEDALAPDVATGDILSVLSGREDIEREVKELDDKFKFDSLVQDICYDLLVYGEYTLRVVVENGKGIVDIRDDVEQSSVFAIPKGGEIDKYLVRRRENGREVVELVEPYEYVKFILSGRKIRLNMEKELGPLYVGKIKEYVPKFVRIGRSVIYSIIPKIRELQVLETLVPVAKLNKLTQGSVLGVTVPSNMRPEDAFKVAKKVEELLNRRIGVHETQKSLSIENAIASAGRLRVVPVFGDKGQVTRFDYKMEEPDELMASIEDLRRTICSSVGIPYETIFGGEGPKSEILKRYARYLRRLKAIQKAIADGVKQIIYIHLTNKGISFRPSEIQVDFRNKLIEIDNLDALEFLDASIGMLTNVRDFVYDMASEESPLAGKVDVERFAKFLDRQLSIVGLRGVIKGEEE